MITRFWIVCYDITDAKRLRRVARVMETFGMRVQKSVFECWLDDARLRELQTRLNALLEQGDNVRYYHLCETCRKTTDDIGTTLCQGPNRYYIV